MTMHNREDSKKIKQIANLLRKNGIPFEERLHDSIGPQLFFQWANGADVVCHEGTFHVPESMGFPWDYNDVSRFNCEDMAANIVALYRKGNPTQPLNEYHIRLDKDMLFNAKDAHEAISMFLACLEDADFEVTCTSNPRQEWIDQHYKEAMDTVNTTDCYDGSHIAHLKFCKDTTIFIRHWIDDDDYVGVAAPRHDDKYDRKTGIAVAYAKAMGEAVPNYI